MMAFRRFGGRDHRLNAETDSFHSNRSTGMAHNFAEESNFAPFYSQNSFYPSLVFPLNFLDSFVQLTFNLMQSVSKIAY